MTVAGAGDHRSLPVSLHDVYNPGFWDDATPGKGARDSLNLPYWYPNPEGVVVLSWLAFFPACSNGVWAPATHLDYGRYIKLLEKRESLALGPFRPNPGRLDWETNPTVFFMLVRGEGCGWETRVNGTAGRWGLPVALGGATVGR